MTKEEAICYLKASGMSDEQIKSVIDAFTCEDCISREEAIDAITKIHPVDTEYDCTLYDKLDVMYVLKDLPSVTPSIPDVENNFNLGYNCGYADAMSDIAESEE